MLLSDISIKRPVFATVMSLILIVLGVVSFTKLPLRELPDVDPPVVSVRATYTGASAAVVGRIPRRSRPSARTFIAARLGAMKSLPGLHSLKAAAWAACTSV